jgi:hypothetical protein
MTYVLGLMLLMLVAYLLIVWEDKTNDETNYSDAKPMR